MKERQLQSAVAEFLGWALPDGCYFTSIPGGDGRATRAPGWRSGTPDLMILWRGRAIFIELKAPAGRLSDAQKDAALAITFAGGLAYSARSVEEVEELLRALQIPLRGKVEA